MDSNFLKKRNLFWRASAFAILLCSISKTAISDCASSLAKVNLRNDLLLPSLDIRQAKLNDTTTLYVIFADMSLPLSKHIQKAQTELSETGTFTQTLVEGLHSESEISRHFQDLKAADPFIDGFGPTGFQAYKNYLEKKRLSQDEIEARYEIAIRYYTKTLSEVLDHLHEMWKSSSEEVRQDHLDKEINLLSRERLEVIETLDKVTADQDPKMQSAAKQIIDRWQKSSKSYKDLGRQFFTELYESAEQASIQNLKQIFQSTQSGKILLVCNPRRAQLIDEALGIDAPAPIRNGTAR